MWRVFDRFDKTTVALKRVNIRNQREGFPLASVREIRIMKALNMGRGHRNITRLRNVVHDDELNTYLVLEYVEHDLTGFMQYKKRSL